MDWLLEIKDQLEKNVFDQVADLLNLEVDLLFFDTTSTYFETEADEPVSPRTRAGTPGAACAASSTASTSAPSPARPAPSGSAPRSPGHSTASCTG
jgi:hypothetical protein